MPLSIREELARDIAAAVGGYGQTMEWSGDVYPCVRRDTPTRLELQESGGFIEVGTQWLVIAKSAFPGAIPAVGDAIDNNTRQVKSINGAKDDDAAQLIIETGSFDQ